MSVPAPLTLPAFPENSLFKLLLVVLSLRSMRKRKSGRKKKEQVPGRSVPKVGEADDEEEKLREIKAKEDKTFLRPSFRVLVFKLFSS